MGSIADRKKNFVELLQKLLDRHRGVKARLAKELGISPSRLAPWLQGKVDPASLEFLIFARIARINNCSVDRLAQILGLAIVKHQKALNKFQILILELLRTQTQESLAKKFDLSQTTISSWIAPDSNIDPAKIPAATMAKIAAAKGWTIEELLSYLEIDPAPATGFDLADRSLNCLKDEISQLSVKERLELIAWIANSIPKLDRPPNND
ncbi:MAG: helix-turn-helix domain-containing protein [Prochloraceae cyanobacterium]|nr:helix-turn-helix domain-containing protein [Prochloraceae cyanobacterium]